MTTFVKKEAIDFGWNTVKTNLKDFIMFSFALILLNAIPQVIQNYLAEQSKNNPDLLIFGILLALVSIASFLLNIVVSIGMIRYALKFADGKKADLNDLFATNKTEVWHYFLGSLLYGIRVLLGFILLIIPGIIWSIKYSQYSYLIVDKKLSPSESIKKSGEITEGNKMNLFLFSLLLGIINIAGLLALFVGLFVTIPLTLIAQAYVYRKLSNSSASTFTNEKSTPSLETTTT